MNEAYTKLMLQQQLSKEADAEFYEQLERASTRNRNPGWKAAVIAACVCLLIPVTVLAAKYIIHRPQVNETQTVVDRKGTLYNRAKYKSMETVKEVGYEIEFPDVEFFSAEDLPEEYQNIESKAVAYDSWNDAVDALDMGLLKNSFLDSDNITPIIEKYIRPYGSEPAHCAIGYCCAEGQPFVIYQQARYKYDQIEFAIIATIGFEHALLTEEDYEIMRKAGAFMAYRDRPSITNKEYTTANGIPMVISRMTTTSDYQDNLASYDVDFAVNNIIYHIEFGHEEGYMFRDHNYIEEVEALIPQILEGFVLE